MGYKTLSFKIIGVVPLLMHNGQLADPLNEFSRKMRELSSKRDKTDADFQELGRLEWFGSLYLEKGKPCLPGEVLEAALVAAARKQKKGKQAQAGIICPQNYPLTYNGARKIEDLWTDQDYQRRDGVRVQQNRVIRTRPIFKEWSCKIQVQYDDGLLNEQEVKHIVRVSGEVIGVGDWRPKFGRFRVDDDG